MKRIFFVLVSILLCSELWAQKKVSESELDVDRIYNLYKDTSDIVIKTGGKEIKAKIKITLNAFDKPYSVIAYGEADAEVDDVLQKLKTELGVAKLQAGYKQSQGTFPVTFNPTGSYEHTLQISYFQKGTQSAKYGIQKIMYNDQDINGLKVPRHVSDFFYFEVCDEGRRNAAKTEEKFVF
ncbi:hypothetical protein [uncultured Mucilaginibacter sp.]|uniref:hypothetical protein n=1 Tax=uncultured Mucilaginibacter sp. TaxID=797541 RepID=UPI0025DEEF77|nr:hypothetical protein [uncultured Mucilaginibacter sp.]